MKKLYAVPVLLLLLISFIKVSKASHVSGGDLTYVCIGPNQYEITFKMYRDCSGITVPTTIPVTFTNTCALTNPASINLTLRNPVTNAICTTPDPCAVEVSQLCPSQMMNSTCHAGGTLPGMQEYIYRGVVTFPGQCNSWTVAHVGSARNVSDNVTGSTGQNYYFEAVLKTLTAPCNNSPVFTAQPIPYTCVSTPVSYNLATTEIDGDSLNFTLIDAKNGPGSSCPYNPGYSGTAPIPGITINPSTGQLNFTPTALGNYIVVVQVEEFNAAGQSLGTVYRDFQFVVQSCTNTPPDPTSGTISNLTGSAVQTGPYTLQMCVGDDFTFDAEYTDPNAGDDLSFLTNITSNLTGSTFTNTSGLNPIDATFSWTAPSGTGGTTLSFVVTVEDDACPIPGINTYTYTINVVAATTAGSDKYYCPAGGPVQLLATGGSSFTWSPAAGLSCTTCPDPLASPASTTTYTVTSNLSTGCVNVATVTVHVVPNFILTPTSDTTICRNNAAFLYASTSPAMYAPYTYAWTPSYALSSTTTATTSASPQYTNMYYVAVTSNTGCTIRDSVLVTISGEAAVIYASSDQTLVCPGTQVQLNTSFMQPCGIVDYGCTGPVSNVQIGNGIYADGYSTTPFYGNTYMGESKHQYIYTAAELAAAIGGPAGGKNITELSFNLSGVPSILPAGLPPVPPTAYINIKIGCSTQGEFTTYTAPFINGLIPVKTNYLFTPANGWNTIVLDNTYRWDGESDIVVEVCTNVGFQLSVPAIYTSTFPKYYTLYKNTSTPTDTTASGCIAINGIRSSSRTDIRFKMCDAVPTAGYSFSWSPAGSLSNSTIPNPLATINHTTSYEIVVTDLAAPQCLGITGVTVYADSTNEVIASPDTVVCPGATVQLNALVTGPPPTSSIPCGANNTPCGSPQYLTTIGAGTTFNGTTEYPAPYGNWYWGAKHQILYTAADLIAAGMESGTISELAFNVAALNGGTTNYQNVQIKMGCSPLTALTTWQTGLSTVYTAPSYTVALGWNTHVFTTSFDWDGTSSIIVEFCFNNSSYIQNISTYWTTTPFTSVVRYIADNSTVCAAPGGPTSSNKRPNIRFKSCDAPPVFLTYNWAPAGSVSNPTISNPTTLINSASSFTVTVTGTHCTLIDTVDINIGTITPTITASGPLTFCNGDSVILTSSLSTGNTWSTGATTQSITVFSAGNYSVTSSCGTTSLITTVTVNPSPSVLVNSATICAGASATLSGGGATSYTWSTGSMSNPISVSPLTTTSYTVTGTSSGCSSTAVSTVTVNPVPTISVNSVSICNGSSATLTSTPSSLGGTYSWMPGGGSTQTISVSPSSNTTYTVTYTLLGCSNTGTGTATVNPLPTATLSGGGMICPGSTSTMNITLTGTGPWSFSYSDGSTTTPVTGVATSPYTITTGLSGNYSLISVSDANCNGTMSGTASITYVSPIIISNVVVACNGMGTNYGVSFEITGGDAASYIVTGGTGSITSSAPYIYSDSVASSDPNYSYSITDGFNCAPQTISGVQNCNCPAAAVMSGGGTICAGASTTVNITLSGVAPWDITYSDGTSNTTVTGIVSSPYIITTGAAGSYSVVSVSDANCMGSSSGAASVIVNPVPTVSVNSSTICEGSSENLIATPSTLGGTYSWSTGGSTQTIAVNPATTTTYSVTYTLSGCSNSGTGTVTVNALPTILVNSTSICSGSTATLTASGGTTYSWSTGSTGNPESVSPSVTTSYTVTGTTSGCSNTAVATVTVSAAMSVAVNSPTICEGQTATLTSSGGTTYTWSTGGSSNPEIVSPLATTSYTVTGTTSGCSGTAIATVTVAPVPSVSVNSQTICEGQTATLTSSGGTSYSWSTGGTSISETVSPLTTTSYTVTGTTSGCSATAVATVTVNPVPTVTTLADIAACVNSTIPTSTFTSTPSGATFSWTNSNTLIGIPASGSGDITSFSATNASASPIIGTITVIPTLGGCTGPAEVYTITVNPDPTAFISGGGTLCNGASANVNITFTGAAPWDVIYSNGSVNTAVTGIATPGYSFTTADSGTYSVVAISDANCNGTASGNVNVDNYPPIQVSISGLNSVCPGSPTTLTALASGGSGPYAYSWSPAGSGSSINVSPSTTTTYIVNASDGCATAGIDTIVVNMLPIPNVAFNSDLLSGCAPMCINLTDASSASGGITNWSWNIGTTGSSTLQDPSLYCFDIPGQYSIGLTVTGSNGCNATFVNTNMISVYALPDANIIAENFVSILDPTVSFISNSPNATSWSWNFGDPNSPNNTSTLENPDHTYSEPGTYCVSLFVQNGSGCVDTTEYCVIVEEEFAFFVPDAFSPNGDGLNDDFMGKGNGILDFKMSIYDRWGNLVYSTQDITKGWNGSIQNNGEICQMDVYVYNITLREGTNWLKYHNYIGKVTLVK